MRTIAEYEVAKDIKEREKAKYEENKGKHGRDKSMWAEWSQHSNEQRVKMRIKTTQKKQK